MGHGTVADEIKGRNPPHPPSGGAILESTSRASSSAPTTRGGEFMGPETSMASGRAELDIALVFDECLPFHVTREYTPRPRSARPLARPLPSLARAAGPARPGRVRDRPGGVEEDLRRWSAQEVAAHGTFGIAIGGTLGQDKPQMYEVVGWTTKNSEAAPAPPAGDRRRRRPPARRRAGHRHVRLRDADPDRPPGDGDRAGARAPLARRPRQGPTASRRRLRGALPACAAGYSRAYSLPVQDPRDDRPRIVTLHNLAYLQLLMAALRDAIDAGRLDAAVAAARAGAPPWAM